MDTGSAPPFHTLTPLPQCKPRAPEPPPPGCPAPEAAQAPKRRARQSPDQGPSLKDGWSAASPASRQRPEFRTWEGSRLPLTGKALGLLGTQPQSGPWWRPGCQEGCLPGGRKVQPPWTALPGPAGLVEPAVTCQAGGCRGCGSVLCGPPRRPRQALEGTWRCPFRVPGAWRT